MAYIPKEILREQLMDLVSQLLNRVAGAFGLSDLHLHETVFGSSSGEDGEVAQRQRENFCATRAWKRFVAIYDFAVQGELKNRSDPYLMLNEWKNLLSHLPQSDPFVVHVNETIFVLANGRNSLESGYDLRFEELVLLANVDERTVRNAISAGELTYFKNEAKGFVSAASARDWLEGRRGFVRTYFKETIDKVLSEIKTPAEFGAFLNSQRTARNAFPVRQKTPEIQHEIEKLEQGIFDLPLSRTFQLADFYCLNRGEFIDCVMRIYFPNQYDALIPHVMNKQ